MCSVYKTIPVTRYTGQPKADTWAGAAPEPAVLGPLGDGLFPCLLPPLHCPLLLFPATLRKTCLPKCPFGDVSTARGPWGLVHEDSPVESPVHIARRGAQHHLEGSRRWACHSSSEVTEGVEKSGSIPSSLLLFG